MAIEGTVTRIEYPNYSGFLFNKGQTKTPFSTMIGLRPKFTSHCEFAVGQEYETPEGEQPGISEQASLTAPKADPVKRTQFNNITQIFHKTVSVSYAKQSDMGTLSGINSAGQMPNPVDEVDFQAVASMQKISQDIEYTFINGIYHKATSKTDPNKTRGILEAVVTNSLDVNGTPLTYWLVAEALKCIYEKNAPTVDLVLGVDATTLLQLNYDAVQNKMTIVPNARNINGISIMNVLTPLGEVGVALLNYLPGGTAVVFDPMLMSPVYQPVPGKGNFFMEPLSKTGASDDQQIFGQVGLDYGPEWYYAKLTNISTKTPVQLINGESGKLGDLTVTSTAGSNVGDTMVTISPSLSSGNSYKYKVAGNPTLPTFDATCATGYSVWDGTSDITAATGQKIVVVEVDANNKAKKAGMATVTAKE